MKITVYTIKDCAFSKQEKEYLNTNKLVFEEKDLETNKDFLTEMLAISNNFAGTPVTRVEKDDGTIAVLKGFTKEEFDTTLGLTPVAPPSNNETPIPPTPVEPISPAPVASEVPVSPPSNPEPINQVTNNQASVSPDPLKSVMDDLQAKAEPAPVVEQAPVAPPPIAPQVSNEPIVPPTPPTVDPAAPVIPDFPAK